MKSPCALQQLQHNAADLAHRAQILLLSASGWSVPAIAEACGCCRRAIRGWIHAFEQGGLLAMLGKPLRATATARRLRFRHDFCAGGGHASGKAPGASRWYLLILGLVLSLS
jgi:hypothetical protein